MNTEQRLPRVSIILVAYNSAHYLHSCLTALLKQHYPNYEVIIVDNGSSDDAVALIEREFPWVHLICAGENLGFGGGNNRGAQDAKGEILAFLNVDTVVDPDWLFPLVEMVDEHSEVGLATAKLLLLKEPQYINTCGNDVHFTGMGFLRGWQSDAVLMTQDEDVFGISGAAFVIRRDLYMRLGGFDQRFYPAYVEDTDLCWRARLAGYRCRYAHRSIVYHDYKASFTTDKYFWLERNRYQLLLKNLRWRTLALILPGLLLTEFVSWGYALLNGHAGAKLSSYRWLMHSAGQVIHARATVEHRVPDRDILRACTYRLAFSQTSTGLVACIAQWVFDPLFWIVHRTTLLVIRW